MRQLLLDIRPIAAPSLSNFVAGANRDLLAERVRTSAGLATALNPVIGYENATWAAREALRSGRSVAELVLERGLADQETLERVLRPEVLTAPRA